MDFDEFLAHSLADGFSPPTLRLFQWKPWAISLGHHQNASDIDLQRCREDGIDVVRRPTGGRAILHAEELTYSVVVGSDDPSVLRTYAWISKSLVRGLQRYGVDVELSATQPNFSAEYRSPSSIPCFSSSARYEILWHGRKVVGSAQRRISDAGGSVILQHGSILTGPAHRQLADYLVVRPEIRDRIRHDLAEKTVDIAGITGRAVDIEHLTECLKEGFAEEIEFAPTSPEPALA